MAPIALWVPAIALLSGRLCRTRLHFSVPEMRWQRRPGELASPERAYRWHDACIRCCVMGASQPQSEHQQPRTAAPPRKNLSGPPSGRWATREHRSTCAPRASRVVGRSPRVRRAVEIRGETRAELSKATMWNEVRALVILIPVFSRTLSGRADRSSACCRIYKDLNEAAQQDGAHERRN